MRKITSINSSLRDFIYSSVLEKIISTRKYKLAYYSISINFLIGQKIELFTKKKASTNKTYKYIKENVLYIDNSNYISF